MSELSAPMAAAWRTSVVEDFAASELFDRTFQEGMELVEDAAAYLDGAGRQESKLLSRAGAIAYAAESMRLTTRLMQLASWLLVQRAVREGDMQAHDACDARYRLKDDNGACSQDDAAATLPGGLKALIEQADRLYERVLHLDRRMYVEQAPTEQTHPVFNQMDRIQAAFGT